MTRDSNSQRSNSGRRVVDFLILGAQKAGTTAAAFNLNLHHDVHVFSGVTKFNQYEIEFFNQHWGEGVEWYQSHFDYSQHLVGEKTAELLHRKICHARMASVAPVARLIVLLRCPVERAYSQWRMASDTGWNEQREFRQVVADEEKLLESEGYLNLLNSCADTTLDSWREGYLAKGFYLDQLSHLLQFYPREQLYIAVAERVRRNMLSEYGKMFSFLGVEPRAYPYKERFPSPERRPMDSATRARLARLYREHNERLFEFLDYEIDEWQT